jgi:GTP diphosphokinase / guanosine-3',5'-bis(diphosphate) 3'-diphosphatase
MNNSARQIVEAFAFAAHAHAFQKRDDMGDAYVIHLAEVAASCAQHEPFDPVLVTAAILHDTLEDTSVTEQALRERFGDDITDVVLEVTDPPGLKGKARRERQVAHIATASTRAKILKIADKTSNVAELADLPKGGIGKVKKARRYLEWSSRVVDVCRGSDADLEFAFDTALARAQAGLEIAKEKSA